MMELCGWCERPRQKPSPWCRRAHGRARSARPGRPQHLVPKAHRAAIAALPEGATPRRIDRDLGEHEIASGLKRPDCAHYESCLDVAATGCWVQWRCDGCGAYERVEADSQLAVAAYEIWRLIA